MKHLKTLAVALFFALTGAISAQAQSVKFGIVAGYNLSKLKFKGGNSVIRENLDSKNRSGFYIGPKIQIGLLGGLSVDGSIQYSQRKLNVTNSVADAATSSTYFNGSEYVSDNVTYRTIEIPINVRYTIGLSGKAGVYVATGPQFGFALQNMKWKTIGSGSNFSKDNMNMTWNIGAGVRLLDHVEVGVGYNFALGKVGKALWSATGYSTGNSSDTELKYKTNTFQVQVAYIF